jgi:hypothetical protein
MVVGIASAEKFATNIWERNFRLNEKFVGARSEAPCPIYDERLKRECWYTVVDMRSLSIKGILMRASF